MVRSIAFGVAVTVMFPLMASAAPNCSAVGVAQSCTCATELADGTPIAELSGIEGDVRKTEAGAYTPTSGTTAMNAGDGVLIGDGKALLTSGPSCQLMPLGSQTSVVTGEVEGCGCVWVAQREPPPVPKGNGAAAAITVVGAGAAAAALIIQAQQEDSGPISP